MKKILSMILCVILLLAFGAVSAETAEVEPSFGVSYTLPDGYESAEEFWLEPTVVYLLPESTDMSLPMIDVTISYEEMMNGVTFTRESWDSDAVQNCARALSYDTEAEQYDPYDILEAAEGTLVMIIHEIDFTRMMTVRDGYKLTIFVSDKAVGGASVPAENETVDMIMKFISDLRISRVSG